MQIRTLTDADLRYAGSDYDDGLHGIFVTCTSHHFDMSTKILELSVEIFDDRFEQSHYETAVLDFNSELTYEPFIYDIGYDDTVHQNIADSAFSVFLDHFEPIHKLVASGISDDLLEQVFQQPQDVLKMVFRLPSLTLLTLELLAELSQAQGTIKSRRL